MLAAWLSLLLLPCSPDPAKKLGAVLAIDELVLVKVSQ